MMASQGAPEHSTYKEVNMSKSKQTKLFVTEDGRRARFNFDEFKYAIMEARKKPNPEKPGARTTDKDIYRKIAVYLWTYTTEEVLESNIGTIVHWHKGRNGPSRLEDIYKMAECLDCEKRDQFLKYEKEENSEMNSNTNSQQPANPVVLPTLGQLTESSFRAMKRMRVQEEAYKLHSMFLDLIAAYNQADMDTWLGNNPLSPEWIEAAKKYPDRCPVELAVHKSSCYLSEELRHSLFAFLEDMYGPVSFDWVEINNISGDINGFIDGSEFVGNKLKRFSAYLEDCGIEEASLDYGDREGFMYDFLRYEADNWYFMLERVFENYVVE